VTEIYLLALVVILASGLAFLAKKLHLPLLVAYLGAGAFLSALHIVKPEQLHFLAILPDIGLAFLLFLVGMELDLKEFRTLGKNVLLATIGQVLLTCLAVGMLLLVGGYSVTSAVFVGLALSFSSTILVVKLLLEGRELTSIFGKLSIGILLVEDLLAVVALMFISVLANGGTLTFAPLLLVFLKGMVLMAISLEAGRRVLPRILTFSASSSELLILTAIAWCLLLVSISSLFGFSLAIGAFLAGVSLAQSVYRIQITSRIKPLRDFFIMIFFLDLGTGLSLSGLSSMWVAAVLFLFYAILFKPFIFFLLFTAFRFRAHSAFQTGILLSSVSEFSLILVASASKAGLVEAEFVSPLIFATVFSFVFSSLLITHGRGVYGRLKEALKFFEVKNTLGLELGEFSEGEFAGHAVLIGCHRSGQLVLPALVKQFGKKVLVLDFNPEVVTELRRQGQACLYGDVSDVEVVEKLNLKDVRLAVSTVRNFEDNLVLLEGMRQVRSKAAVLLTALDATEARELYRRGAHYVLLPLALEGANLAHLISAHDGEYDRLIAEKDLRVKELNNEV